MSVSEVIDRLEELHKNATPGIWYAPQFKDQVRSHAKESRDSICVLTAKEGMRDNYANNSELIAASKNALPALLKIARAAEDWRDDNWRDASHAAELEDALAELEGMEKV